MQFRKGVWLALPVLILISGAAIFFAGYTPSKPQSLEVSERSERLSMEGSQPSKLQSFTVYKTSAVLGQDFVIETGRCTYYSCFWRTAHVLELLKTQLFEAGHKNDSGNYPILETEQLLPWVTYENGNTINLIAGEIAAVEVETLEITDNSKCPIEAQIKYLISNSGVANPIAGVMSQIFAVDNPSDSDDELYVTMRECFKNEAEEWKQTRWGFYLRET